MGISVHNNDIIRHNNIIDIKSSLRYGSSLYSLITVILSVENGTSINYTHLLSVFRKCNLSQMALIYLHNQGTVSIYVRIFRRKMVSFCTISAH